MARIGVRYEEVELHANIFLHRGDNPTLEKIRRALGDRGSNSTLSKHLNQWRLQQADYKAKNIPIQAHLIGSSELKPSVTLPEAINECIARFWLELKKEAKAEALKEASPSIEALMQDMISLDHSLQQERLVRAHLEEKLTQIEAHILEMIKR